MWDLMNDSLRLSYKGSRSIVSPWSAQDNVEINPGLIENVQFRRSVAAKRKTVCHFPVPM